MDIYKLIEERSLANRAVAQIQSELWEFLKKQRTNLERREYKVLKLRLIEHKTFEEVGKVFGVTRERVRQVECKALEKLYYANRMKDVTHAGDELIHTPTKAE